MNVITTFLSFYAVIGVLLGIGVFCSVVNVPLTKRNVILTALECAFWSCVWPFGIVAFTCFMVAQLRSSIKQVRKT